MDYGLIDIRTRATEGMGQLSFFEAGIDIPFSIKRIYYTYDVPVGKQRGGHAHHELQQLLICPHGKIEVILFDGISKNRYILDDPSKGLLVPKMVWHDMIWMEEGSVLMVAASDYYNESDYIRNHDIFLEHAQASSSEKGLCQ